MASWVLNNKIEKLMQWILYTDKHHILHRICYPDTYTYHLYSSWRVRRTEVLPTLVNSGTEVLCAIGGNQNYSIATLVVM